jgi:hypothetical protein
MMNDLYDTLDEDYNEEEADLLNEYGYDDEEEEDLWSKFDSFDPEEDFLEGFKIENGSDEENFVRMNSNKPTNFTSDIIKNESGGNYKAFNPAGGGEGAVGKYQFRWTTHKPTIRKFAGNPNLTKEQFMNSPELQDAFYEQYWIPNELEPSVQKIRRSGLGKNLSEDQLASLVHFRGSQGALDYLTGKTGDKPESYNMSISKYIGSKQTGGNILGLSDSALQQVDSIGSGVLNAGNDIIDFYRKNKQKLGQSISTGVETGIGLLNSQQEAIQNRNMLERMYQDNPLQYGNANKNINNVPIYTQVGGKSKFKFNWKK